MLSAHLKTRKLLAVLAIGLCSCLSLHADGKKPAGPNDRHSFTIYFENDLFSNTDRDYTNGVRFSWLSQDLESLENWPLLEKIRLAVPWFAAEGRTHNVGIAFGQSIYTPEDIHTGALMEDDRPYAAWLYGTLSLHRKTARDLHRIELTLGVVGPEAMGEEAQNGVHKIRSIATADGWDNQLDTEIGLIFGYDYLRRWSWQFSDRQLWGLDAISIVGGRLGNVLTEAKAGAVLRLGWNVPRDFHGSRIDSSGYTLPPKDADILERDSKISVYCFASLEGHAVGHSIFLDGNTFSESHDVKRIPWIAESELGIGIRWGGFRITYAQVFRTREFEEQGEGQQYGSVSLSWAGSF